MEDPSVKEPPLKISGVVRRANHSEAMACFDGNTDHRHHLVCLGCHSVTDLDGLKLGPIKLPDARRTGFEIADYSIHFEGYCPVCRRKKTKSPPAQSQLKKRKVTSIEASVVGRWESL